MSTSFLKPTSLIQRVTAQTGVPALVLAILIMMLVPLPAIALDVMFTLNIGLSILILVSALNIKTFKDFVAFPSLLLVATLLRLSLNVASTRVILLRGHTGPDAAGKIIESFGEFLIGGSFAVGLVIFSVITVINFVVITKGAGRVAEVSARFILDALPGKQMAIDADLNSGLLKSEEAKSRRQEVSQEADFFGSMDGASKFVRGDAIAGILILVINIIGGAVIGMTAHSLSLAKSLTLYGTLTIGDGLVAQIPALIISTAAGILVTRVSTDDVFAVQISKQIQQNKNALLVAAGTLFLFSLLPGIPGTTFFVLSILLAGAAYFIKLNTQKKELSEKSRSESNQRDNELGWEDVPVVEPLRLELPYRLIPLIDKGAESELIKRIRAIRRKFIVEIGFLSPSVHIRDNLQLPAETYRFMLFGGEVGRGQCFPDKLLAIAPSEIDAPALQGLKVKDPSFGMPAIWIERSSRPNAITSGYTVVEPSVVITTHLETIMQRHSHELLGRDETQQLLDNFKESYPRLVEDAIPKIVSVGLLQKLLQLLLEENVPIKDLRTILEVTAEYAPKHTDALEILPYLRIALGRTIFSRAMNGLDGDIRAIGIPPDFERLLDQAVGGGTIAPDGAIEPSLLQLLMQDIARFSDDLENRNIPAILAVHPKLRMTLSKIARRVRPQISVLSFDELPPQAILKFEHFIGTKVDQEGTAGE